MYDLKFYPAVRMALTSLFVSKNATFPTAFYASYLVEPFQTTILKNLAHTAVPAEVFLMVCSPSAAAAPKGDYPYLKIQYKQ